MKSKQDHLHTDLKYTQTVVERELSVNADRAQLQFDEWQAGGAGNANEWFSQDWWKPYHVEDSRPSNPVTGTM